MISDFGSYDAMVDRVVSHIECARIGVSRIFYLFALIGICFLSCSEPSSPDTGYDRIDDSMTLHEVETYYSLLIPETYDGETAVPLILALHYGVETTPFTGSDFLTVLIQPALREMDAIMAAPVAPFGSTWMGSRTEEIVMSFVDSLRSLYVIDENRILVTGYSMGGQGTWYYAAYYPEVFKAAIPISSRTTDSIADEIHDIPVYVIHSADDEVYDLDDIVRTVSDLQARGESAELSIVHGVTHYNVSGFVDPLSNAIPWLDTVWSEP